MGYIRYWDQGSLLGVQRRSRSREPIRIYLDLQKGQNKRTLYCLYVSI